MVKEKVGRWRKNVKMGEVTRGRWWMRIKGEVKEIDDE